MSRRVEIVSNQPNHRPSDSQDAAERLAAFFLRHPRTMVLTGAGCSTASGIPDYRDDDGQWKHAEPMRYAQFVGELRNRQRYWARSFAGWARIAGARPNPAHHALSALEHDGHVTCVATQNVDALHQKAGSRMVIDLHGVLQRVCCLGCGDTTPRDGLQRRLRRLNPQWHAAVRGHAPDGDARLAEVDLESFVVPDCEACGAILKPDVVFFGESVPRGTVEAVHRQLRSADALVVIGSSLMVYSGYRFVRAAHEAGTPTAIVNRGRTRADHLATEKIAGDCAQILPKAVACLSRSGRLREPASSRDPRARGCGNAKHSARVCRKSP